MAGAPTAAAFGAALALAGLGFGSPSLVVPGIGLLGLAIGAVAWVELAAPRRIVREPGPGRVIEDQPFRLRIDARSGRLPPPGGELTDPVLEAPIAVGPRWDRQLDVEVRLHGRGRRPREPARLVVRDPLGLRTRFVVSDELAELIVLPRIDPVAVSGRGGAGGAGVIAGIDEGAASGTLEARAVELEVDGLRAYREGSPASRIHWPAVARTGELIERRMVAGADSAPLVVLDASLPASPQALDAAVRAAGSLCWHLAQTAGCGILLPGDRRPTEVASELRGWPAVHTRLAVVEAAASPPALAQTRRAGTVFWVTARDRPALPAAVRHASGRRFLVGPAVAGRGAPALTVSGCEGRRVGARTTSLGRAA
jgi:uncharacterized protein (DUF58 family)